MTDTLTLYTNPQSRGRIARWMLEEVGEPYETVLLDYGTTMKSPEYLAINPMGKVPALKHGDRVVTEAAAICAYLADAFPDAGLAPPSADRASYCRWLFFAAGPLEAAITGKALGLLAPEDKKMMAGYGSFDEVLNVLDGAVSRVEYLCGDRFTACDLYLGSQLGYGMMFGLIEPRAAFTDYLSRIQSRPAYSRANGIDEALVPQQQSAA